MVVIVAEREKWKTKVVGFGDGEVKKRRNSPFMFCNPSLIMNDINNVRTIKAGGSKALTFHSYVCGMRCV